MAHFDQICHVAMHMAGPGKEGKVTVEPTETEGIFITWVDRDPETLARQEAIEKKERMEATGAELEAERLQQQIERGKVSEKDIPATFYTEFQRDGESEKVAVLLAAGASTSAPVVVVVVVVVVVCRPFKVSLQGARDIS